MQNSELLKVISEINGPDPTGQAETQEKTCKMLVFMLNENSYAFPAEQIQEIILSTSLHFVPFVPPYITGFINRHGEPFTVFDLSMLFENKKTEDPSYLIFKHEQDHIAVSICDVSEILTIKESSIHPMVSGNREEGFFTGAITIKEKEVFIIDIQQIINRLQHDLEIQ